MSITLKLALALAIGTTGVFGGSVNYTYVNWTTDVLSTTTTAGSASGSLTLGSDLIHVSYTGDVASATQVGSGGINYYVPPTVYTNAQVANVPSNNNVITLDQDPAYTNVLTFSSALLNPILDIVSLGAPGVRVTYTFNATPTILSQGTAYWGGCSTCLSVTGNSLTGTEGSGVIEFTGSYTSLTWTTTGGEYWNGFTVGVQGLGSPVSRVPEPETWALIFPVIVMAVILRRKRSRIC